MTNHKNDFFKTEHLHSGMKKKSLRSGATTITAQGLSFAIQMASTMVLARLLTPEDYGVIAMVATITGLASILASLGLSTATIQSSDINHDQVSGLFWINVGIGIIVTLTVAAMSPLIAWFYNSPLLLWVVIALSLDFSISSLGVQHRALLNRQMRFLTLAKIEVGAMSCGLSLAIILAYYDFGYWALVFNRLCSVTASTIMAWIAVKWIPSLPRRNSGVLSLLKFGSNIMVFNVINYFSRNTDNILIGRYYGEAELGIYNKAYQLLMMPIINLRDPLMRVALPALSKLQKEPIQYRNYFLKYISILAFISMPLIMFLFIFSDQIINIVLGENWSGASIIFKILALAAFIQPISTSWGLVLLSIGKSKRYLHVGIINAIITIIFFILGLPWGAKGMAIAYSAANYILLYPTLHYAFKNTPITKKDFFLATLKPLLSSLTMGSICFYLLFLTRRFSDFTSLAICFIAGLVTYIFAFAILFRGKKDLDNYYSYGKLIFFKKTEDS